MVHFSSKWSLHAVKPSYFLDGKPPAMHPWGALVLESGAWSSHTCTLKPIPQGEVHFARVVCGSLIFNNKISDVISLYICIFKDVLLIISCCGLLCLAPLPTD